MGRNSHRVVFGFFVVFALPFLASAQTGTPCNQYGSGSAPPAGYGAAWNVLSSANELLVYTNCGTDSTTYVVGSGGSNQFVYKIRYFYSGSERLWKPSTLEGVFAQGSPDWIVGKGVLTAPGTIVSTPLYWVGYLCQWTGSQWKCGCQDSVCATNYWQLQASTNPFAPPGTGGTTSGTTGGTTATSKVESCTGPRINVGPSTAQSALDAHDNAVILLAPGTYRGLHPVGKSCLEIRCMQPALVNGAVNTNGCVFTDEITGSGMKNLIIENLVFVVDKTAGGGDYGIKLYSDKAVRIANNAFRGVMNHDISTKEKIEYAEVLNNTFIRCARHCIEIGQNRNQVGHLTTSDTMIVRNNVFDSPLINALTQRHNRNLIVENNEFKNVGQHALSNWPNWNSTDYGGGATPLLISPPPYRTKFINNQFTGAGRINLQGRGAIDDVVLIKGNTGSVSCRRLPMDAEQAAAHSNEQTTAAPKLDPESDISC